jgi:hypothetical protein
VWSAVLVAWTGDVFHGAINGRIRRAESSCSGGTAFSHEAWYLNAMFPRSGSIGKVSDWLFDASGACTGLM